MLTTGLSYAREARIRVLKDAGRQQARAIHHESQQPSSRLYRNDLTIDAAGRRHLAFTDVTAASHLTARGYGMGVATGDINNDGWMDVYVTNLGADQMWLNRGDGTFTDVTERSDTGDARWATSAGFLDLDHPQLRRGRQRGRWRSGFSRPSQHRSAARPFEARPIAVHRRNGRAGLP